MDLERKVKTGLLGAAALLCVNQLFPAVPLALIPHESVTRPDPRREPVQGEASAAPFALTRRFTGYRITPRASYDIAARVVGTEPYRVDRGSGLLPWDLALTWGKLVDEPYLSKVSYGQVARFYTWSTPDGTLDLGYISSHSANVHVIPANRRIRRILSRLRKGDVVRLEGDLVDATAPDGFEWKTSLAREDTGAGACETLYLRAITVGTKRYR